MMIQEAKVGMRVRNAGGDVEEAEIPMFNKGDIAKDKFGNVFEVVDAKPRNQLDPDNFEYDNMGYRLKLVEKIPRSPNRAVQDGVTFVREGNLYWIYNHDQDVRECEEEFLPYTITASELVKVKSAEIRKYPTIQELRKLSEENDLERYLDRAYAILEKQASLGERNANLDYKQFSRCIPHFKREGFEVLEHGTLIEIGW